MCVFYSSDGRVVDLIPDLIECGINLHDPQLGPNSLEEIARVYAGRWKNSVSIDNARQSQPLSLLASSPGLLARLLVFPPGRLWALKGVNLTRKTG